jgi:rhodanese-related sulfurtransferase
MLQRIFGRGSGTPGVTTDEARRRQAEGALVVDVRERDEWRAGHIAGASLIPLGDLGRRARELPQDRDLLIVCRSGNRSARATALLHGLGFARAVNVAGGMNAWTAAGLPVQRG